MKITGAETLPGTPTQLWELLMDPAVLAATMPGCRELVEVGADRYRGVIEARIGPVSSRYEVTFSVTDREYPTGYRLRMEGEGRGGHVSSTSQITLTEQPDDRTQLRYDSDVHFGGPLAQFGSRLVEPASRMLIRQGFKRLEQEISRRVGEARL